MRRQLAPVLLGILLIAVGVLVLLQNLGVVGGGLASLWALLFGGAGLAFIYYFLTNRENWWALIPGFSLLGIAVLIALGEFAPRAAQSVGGSIFLGSIGLCFVIIYLIRREFWWAMIPGGVLLTLALVAGLDPIIGGENVGGIFFLGLGLTFGAVAVLPTPKGRMTWALIPAGVLFAMGLLILAVAGNGLEFLLPIAMLAAGGYLIYRSVRSRQAG